MLNTFDFALARLNQDGSFDSSFGGDGQVRLDLGGDHEQISGMVLLDNGKIVVAGLTDANGDYDVAFTRFNSNGSLDASFGTAGTTLVDSGTNDDQPRAIARQSDGKFIACGVSEPAPADAIHGAMLAVRANEDGSVDTTYGSNGIVLIQTAAHVQASGCVALPDGSGATVLAGHDGELGNLALARLEVTGSLDHSFGSAGWSSIDLGGWAEALSIVVLDDGKLAVAGRSSAVGRSDIFLARIDAGTGTLDPSFGNQGVTVVDFGQAALQPDATVLIPSNDLPSHGYGLIQQRDGRLVAVGTQHYSLNSLDDHFVFAIARVNPAGTGNRGVVGFVPTDAVGTNRIVTTVREGRVNAILNVRRTGGSVGEVAVDYEFVAGTAWSPSDFTGVNGSVTWADSDVANKTITIPITDDTTPEDVESFSVKLSNSSTPGLALAATEAEVTITDNVDVPEPAMLQFTGGVVGVFEGGSFVLNVARTGPASGAVSVEFATSSGTATAGSDFTSASGTLHWADGDSVSKTITVDTTDDATDEDNETLTVTLSNPSDGATLGPAFSVPLTISDDDPPISDDDPPGGGGGTGVFELLTPAATVSEGGSVGLGVMRIGSAVGAVSVDFETSSVTATAGSDYTSAGGTLYWADGDSASKTITVDTIDDGTDEGVETLALTLSNASGAALGSSSIATVTITDNDPPAVGSGGDADGNGGGGEDGGSGSSDRLFLLGLLLTGIARNRMLRRARPRRAR